MIYSIPTTLQTAIDRVITNIIKIDHAIDNQIDTEQNIDGANNEILYSEYNDDYDQLSGDLNNDTDGPERLDNCKATTTETLRRSSRIRRPTWKVKDNQDRGIRSYSTYYDSYYEEDYTLQ